MSEAWRAFDDARIAALLKETDVDARRRLAMGMQANPSFYSPEYALLLPRVRVLADTDPDDFVRHRLELAFGRGGPLFRPLPTAR